nr:hypothetical protein [uncultured Porphyromonas sp.]
MSGNSTSTSPRTVIMLYGPHDSGKTTSLNHLIGLLDPSQKDWPQGKDRRVLVDYQDKRILVITDGDPEVDMEAKLKFADQQRFDIFVTAARTRGNTRREIRDYAQKLSANLIKVRSYIAPQQYHSLVNLVQADSLKELIEGLIKQHP